MNAMTEAREYALLNRNPVIVHANCVRIGSHSNSDKHTLYRDEGELAYVKAADPLMKFRRMLLRYKRFTEEELKAVEEKRRKTCPQPIVRRWQLPILIRRPYSIMYCPNPMNLKSIRTACITRRKERKCFW